MSKITVNRKLLATQRKIERLIRAGDFIKAEELLYLEYAKHGSHEDFGYINLLTLGRLNMQLGRKDRAEQFLFKAIDVDEHNPEAAKFLAQIYLESKQFHAALRIIDLLLQIDNKCFEYRYWKILALCSVPERSNEILKDWRSIELDFPDLKQDTQIHNAIVFGLLAAGRITEADSHCIKYGLEQIFDSNTGQLLPALYLAKNEPQKAVSVLSKMIEIQPKNYSWQWNRGLILLSLGELQRGWRDYESRWRWSDFPSPKRNLNLSLWDGEDLRGKSIIISAEQGIGDQILFSVSINKLLTLGPKTVRIEVQDKLIELFGLWYPECEIASFQNNPEIDSVLENSFDFHLPMATLTARFMTDRQAVKQLPRRLIKIPEAEKNEVLGEFRENFKYIIGLSWRSSAVDSIRLTNYANAKFAKYIVDALPSDVGFVMLQYTVTEDEKDLFENYQNVFFPEEDFFNDILTHGKYCGSCDIVVSSGTMVAPLAGLFSCPVITWGGSSSWVTLGFDNVPWFPNNHVIFGDANYDRRSLADAIVAKLRVAMRL
jgi:Tfp pilus assembly protein PilF